MMEHLKRHPWVATLVAALLALVGVSVTIEVVDDNRPDEPRKRSVTVRVDGPDRDTKRDDKIVLGEPAQDLVERAEDAPGSLDLGGDLRGKDGQPVGLDPDAPLAAQSWPGCTTAFVRSFSGRNGVAPRAIGLHYTAGGNIAGLADMRGLTAYSNNTANQVSWHFLIDREGNCFYSVPTNHKAWTIAGLNSQTVNIEVVGRGNEPDYAGAAGMKKLSRVVRRIGRIHDIPIQLGAVSNCRVTRPGIIAHWQGGPCSGGHVDIRPYEIAAVANRIAKDAKPKITEAERKRRLWARRHEIAHKRLRENCRTTAQKNGSPCRALREYNRALHALLDR